MAALMSRVSSDVRGAAKAAVVPVEQSELLKFPAVGLPGQQPLVDRLRVVAERRESFDERFQRVGERGSGEGPEMSRAADFIFRLFGRAPNR